ncbi:DUF2058 domain-containing protein [Crenothrix sp.]|uniref:DUF2058 domain-containing protein n=1 Tax=Crenothrix sp. TaxID=3100433 RepID=UPI00374DC288
MTQKKLSLQEQLLKAGLASETKAKQIKATKHKESKLQKHNNVHIVDDIALQVQKAKTEQLAKDRELGALQKKQAEQKATVAQIRQLIELHRKAPDNENGVAYHFNDNSKVKTLYVSELIREQLIKGRLAIVKFDQQYALVPADIAEKIRLRDAAYMVVFNEVDEKVGDDPYAAYQIPDDLMW